MKIGSFAASLALMSLATPLCAQTTEGPSHLGAAGPVAMGSFVGARLRIPLGGTKDSDRNLRAGLTMAPMQRSEGVGLKGPAWRIGEGLEFGFTSDAPTPHFSLAGQRFGPASGRSTPTKGRNNLSDAGTVAAVVVGLAVLAGGGFLLALDAAGDPDPCMPGECNNN